MPRRSIPKPTDGELAILRVLWRRGASTVREVMDELAAQRETGYTTVLKLLQIMTDKGLVRRDESQRTHIYEAAFSEDETQRRLVGDLLERAFGGSAERLVLQALAAKRATREELRQIRQMIEELDREARTSKKA